MKLIEVMGNYKLMHGVQLRMCFGREFKYSHTDESWEQYLDTF